MVAKVLMNRVILTSIFPSCGGSLDEVMVEAGVFLFREICKTLIIGEDKEHYSSFACMETTR